MKFEIRIQSLLHLWCCLRIRKARREGSVVWGRGSVGDLRPRSQSVNPSEGGTARAARLGRTWCEARAHRAERGEREGQRQSQGRKGLSGVGGRKGQWPCLRDQARLRGGGGPVRFSSRGSHQPLARLGHCAFSHVHAASHLVWVACAPYEPLRCTQCEAIVNPHCRVNSTGLVVQLLSPQQ